ncbi:MAG: ABC transporter permease [Saprospiraceae bacterium]|nr:ABC transporter permease [Saprospiraceae bacterium]
MNTIITLAWRNVWRNKRRTLITAASILFAVLLSSFMQSIQKGAWDRMIDNVVNFHFGYLQIHAKGYWEEQSINTAFEEDGPWKESLSQMSDVKVVVPRLESFALAANGNNTKGVMVVGTDPDAENQMTGFKDRIIQGSFFGAEEDAVLVAEGVQENLGLSIGDTLILISQGYHGVNAAGKYLVKGTVKFGSPELNKQMVYLPLKIAQKFYDANGLLTSVAVQVANKDLVEPVKREIQSQLDTASTYEVMDWQTMMPELVQAREVDTAGNVIVLFILYVIIAFGIFGTILMMTKEREYEFGILLAIGMRRLKLGLMVWLEIVFLGLIGSIAGIIASLPLVYYFNINPVDFSKISKDMEQAYEKFGFEPIFPAAFEWDIFLWQAFIVFILTTIMALYPLTKIRKLRAVQAMRG